jgi:hypothetical protein
LKVSSSDSPVGMCSTVYRGIGGGRCGSFDMRMPSLVASSSVIYSGSSIFHHPTFPRAREAAEVAI